LLLLLCFQIVLLAMSEQRKDVEEISDELLQLRLKELVKRPEYGTVGKPIKLACNYFPLIKLQKGDLMVNRYHIDIQHPRLKLNWFDFNLLDESREIFWAYVVKRSDIFGDPFKLAYDGRSGLYTVDKLRLNQVGEEAALEKFSFKTVRENKPSEVTILIKPTGLVHLDFKNAEAGLLDEREKGAVQFLDILFAQGRSCPLFELSKSFKAVKNSFYFISQGADLDVKYGITLWRGLFISARVIDGFRPAINIDVSHSCFYKHQSLINLICDILNGDEHDVKFHPCQLKIDSYLKREHLRLLIPELKGISIHTTHRNQDRVYRIKDISGTAASVVFEKDGKKVSIAEYFHDVYAPLKYPNLPLVQVGSKSKAIYFPVEVCQVANCQRYNKKLKACQTTSIIRYALSDAPTRIQKCIDLVQKSNLNGDPFLKNFGVKIKGEPVIVNGRVLSPPRLEYGKGNGGQQIVLTPKDGAWYLKELKFFESAYCESFGFVSFLPLHKASMLQEFCWQVVRTCRSTGIQMPDNPKFFEQAGKNDSVEMVFKRISEKCDRDGIKCDLVFVALYSPEQYAEVKSCGDITFGLVTQCLLPRTINDVAVKKSYSTMLNIAMKINMKIGGINAKLQKDEILDNYLYKNNTLVIGVDVVHPSAVEKHLPSIAAVVGNVDINVTKFHASVQILAARQELVIGIEKQFRERLVEYNVVNKSFPKNIIVFRDGVSEGQFMQVLDEELIALRRACKSFIKNCQPLITFVVVQKRHHARFFCCDEAAARGRGKNIPAGTVVDRAVTSPDEYDFFLCSHHGIQGTSRPTRYHVLLDESNMNANTMQSITYYLCHIYVSIPAPVYFAHLVCARARYHVLAALNSGLVEKFSDEDSSSSSSSSKAESVKAELVKIIALHSRVKKVMYYA
ncbi:Protein argonaute-2, partial [Trichinella pseudospiralis]